jgi:DNA-binding LytR/AlgR family response regulator
MEYIYFNSRDELLRLRITEIAYFESDGNYCNVVTANKLRSPIGMNLTNLEHALDKQLGNEATTFIRIGKRFIVNKRYICKVNIPKQRLVHHRLRPLHLPATHLARCAQATQGAHHTIH